jgi:hypothetical protein
VERQSLATSGETRQRLTGATGMGHRSRPVPNSACPIGRGVTLRCQRQFPLGRLALVAGPYDRPGPGPVERTVNRREFCWSAVAATSVAVGSLADAGAPLMPTRHARRVRPYRLIFDGRFATARRVGAEAARCGLATTGFNGDVTGLWFNDLGRRWAADRAPVAGITTPEALFCLEQLARDAWMRVTVRAEHASSDAERCGHRVSGRAADVAGICTALDADSDWPARLALALTMGPSTDRTGLVERRIGAGGAASSAGPTVRLVSWMIAA